VRSELHGIAQHVEHDLSNPLRVGNKLVNAAVAAAINDQLERFLFGLRPHQLRGFLHQRT
jgi:hypothetical protein